MEKFEGTGYECLGKCIENGWRGYIIHSSGIYIFRTIQDGKYRVHLNTDRYTVTYDWLEYKCRYRLYKPTWEECTHGDALEAILAGLMVQVNIKELNKEPEWESINIDYTGWRYSDRQYRKEA